MIPLLGLEHIKNISTSSILYTLYLYVYPPRIFKIALEISY